MYVLRLCNACHLYGMDGTIKGKLIGIFTGCFVCGRRGNGGQCDACKTQQRTWARARQREVVSGTTAAGAVPIPRKYKRKVAASNERSKKQKKVSRTHSKEVATLVEENKKLVARNVLLTMENVELEKTNRVNMAEIAQQAAEIGRLRQALRVDVTKAFTTKDAAWIEGNVLNDPEVQRKIRADPKMYAFYKDQQRYMKIANKRSMHWSDE